jgi:hypothetical protein
MLQTPSGSEHHTHYKGRDPPKDTSPVNAWENAIDPYTSFMADEGTVLEEAMDNLKEALYSALGQPRASCALRAYRWGGLPRPSYAPF